MEQTTNVTPVASSVNYAGFWIRVWAAFIDGFILGIVFTIISFFFNDFNDPKGFDILDAITGLLAWLYYAYMESSERQGTLGKMAAGIKVTDEMGNRITFPRATGRHFAKLISTVILFIGYLMVAWTDKKQALHDKIAHTLVVKR